jgi:sugar/nucleoside kinase (ribokinase family)
MTIDDLVFYDGSTKMGLLGGDAVYSTIGAALWQDDIIISAVAGPDYPVGKLSELFGINTKSIIYKERPSLRNWGLYEQDGTRQFIFKNAVEQWWDYSPEPSELPLDLLKGAYFHAAPVPWDRQVKLVKHARESGAKFISVDPPYQTLDKLSKKEISKLLGNADAFLPSRQEARALYPDLNPEQALAELMKQYPNLKVIVIKLGEDGAIGYDREKDSVFVTPAYQTKAIDPTGAGDSFCGGFIAGYAMTGDAKSAVLHGAVSASFVVETEGTLGIAGITREKAFQRLAALKSSING